MSIEKYKNLHLAFLILGLLVILVLVAISFKTAAAAPTLNQQLKAACQNYEKAYKKAGKTNGVKLSKKEKRPHSWCKNFKRIDPSAPGQQLLMKDLSDTKSATSSINKKVNKAKAKGGKKKGKDGKAKGGPTGPFSLSPAELGLERKNPGTSLQSILNGVYAIAGGVAVLMIVISGLLMVVNGDNPQNVATARNSIIFTSIGLVVIILAFVITNVVLAVV